MNHLARGSSAAVRGQIMAAGAVMPLMDLMHRHFASDGHLYAQAADQAKRALDSLINLPRLIRTLGCKYHFRTGAIPCF